MNMLSIIQAGVKAAVECDPRGMSDGQLSDERAARAGLESAIAGLRVAIANVNYASTLVQIDPTTFDHFVHDELSFEWDEKISEARNG